MAVIEGDISQVLTLRKALSLCDEHLQAGQSYSQYLPDSYSIRTEGLSCCNVFAMRSFSSTLVVK